ncbi:beta-glucuronidase [Nesidiocoris tenuis]|uniref:Beta-glucuronidase n=1 Tax=Nesidiocoris tenuis TaxID=355587 RepID=A0ABN7AUW2_9HEMI|nr:beta-glucuronidase [Nesidiocoris tenuis]
MAAASQLCWLVLLQVFSFSWCGILYPRASEKRVLMSLDGIWQFRAANSTSEGIEYKWYKNRLSKTGATIPMPVPSSYNDITQEKSLREHVGTVWYERHFFVPDSWRQNGQRVWLRFGSVHYSARVWLNGEEVMSHEIGHLPFEAEVTSSLRFGQENRLTLEVDNTLTYTTIPQGWVEEIETIDGVKKVQRYTFDFFNYAGIHRPVVLYTTPAVYIDDITTYTDVVGSKGIIYFNLTYDGLPDSHNEINCRVTVFDSHAKPVGKATKEDKIGSGFIGKIEIDDAHLWWPYLMDPAPGYLYTLEVRITTNKEDMKIEDVYRLPIGIRLITWSNTSLYINNVPVYLRGFGRHEDSDIRGKGLDLALVAKDYNLLKWIGANAYRTSHYPYAEEIMDFADQQGIMIIDECPSVNTEKYSVSLLEKHLSSLTQLIQRDKNRPSVIMWSVANEPRTQLPESADYFRSVVKFVKTRDTTRPVTAALNKWYSIDHAGQFMDIIGFNRYNGWYSDPGEVEVIQPSLEREVENWHQLHNKPVMMLEYGADTMPGLHLDPSYIWSEEYQTDLLSEHFKAFDTLRNKSFFIGEMIWNFADFKTDQSTTRVGGNKKGIFTRERQPKSAAFHVRKRYLQLAHEIDGFPLADDLDKYTAPVHPKNEL